MATTAYITWTTAPAIARRMREMGYQVRIADVARQYVCNVVPAFAGMDLGEQQELEREILAVLNEQ